MRAAILAGALLLTGCATTGLNTPHAVLEQTETDAESAYQATVLALNTAVSLAKITQAASDADRMQAWNDLMAVRAAYNAGQSLAASMAALNADKAAAQKVAQ